MVTNKDTYAFPVASRQSPVLEKSRNVSGAMEEIDGEREEWELKNIQKIKASALIPALQVTSISSFGDFPERAYAEPQAKFNPTT